MTQKMTLSSQVTEQKQAYLNAPLTIDVEYIKHYTKMHQQLSGKVQHPIELRAECHAYAMENLTPIINANDLLVGRKTRFTRGAIPYCNYATQFVIKELQNLKQEEQDAVTEVGTGGGIAHGQKIASQADSKFTTFGKKLLILKEDVKTLTDCANYWDGKCMQDIADRLWKQSYGQADYIEKGWKAVLFTAPHDPAPEGRNILDYETALKKGLEQIAQEAEAKIKEIEVIGPETADKIYFWRATARVLRATIAWANNYAKAARALAAQQSNEEDKQRLLRTAEMCEHCPANPPRNFAEAIQSYWLIYCAGHLEGAYMGYSPGRFDQYMLPYFNADKQKNQQQIIDLLATLRIRMTEIEYVASFAWEGLGSGNLFQNMILGGVTENGNPADNQLSLLVIESTILCQTIQPTLSVWYDERLSDKFLMKAAECVKTGVGFPAWFNFQCYAMHEMQTSGTPLNIIRKNAAIGGCTEPTLQGMSYGIVQAGFVNLMKVFEMALNGGKDPRSGIQFTETKVPQNTDELIAAFEQHLAITVQNWQRYWNYVMAAHRQTNVMVFASALTQDCIGRGKSLDDGGAYLNNTPTTLSTGMVNVVNSIAGARSLVDELKQCTFDELRAVLLSNWENRADLLALAKQAPKWGNDDDKVDQIYVKLFDFYCNTVKKQLNYLGKPYDPAMLAITTHAPFGRACFASPDGRMQSETLADGVTSPHYGTDVSGPFSVLLSAQKIDHTKIRGGLHNMKIHPGSIKGQAGSRKLLSLISSYFKNSGSFQIQFNVVDRALLIDAQKNPQNYRDLIVRVAGFSAYFVELSKTIQDEVIARTEHSLGEGNELDDEDVDDGVLGAIQGNIFNVQDFSLHDGPGVRSTVFLKGCPLKCKWCSNPEGQKYELEDTPDLGGKRISVSELVSQLERKGQFFGPNGGVTLSGGEPLSQPKFAYAVVKQLSQRGIKVAVETSGQWCWDECKKTLEMCQLIYFDLKAGNAKVHLEWTGVDNRVIVNNLNHTVKMVGADKVVVSIPVIPGVNDNEEEMKAIMRIATGAGVKQARLLSYHELGSNKYEKIGMKYEMKEGMKVKMEQMQKFKEIFANAGIQCTIAGGINE
ncbi:4-hydroxyphenylacetate_decarboxylase [Hexamita inflata]|uniref:4-hydroxyphenylacetate decarboxylase n=1 Tax=Hexamita inflata TaxID=28002 RepID=A0AA86PEP6_9EUKA|nr:4-hydroxyphenylacetate decarboxylase [Hexamita inflata]CAI9959564.1 4-hydroxyphenylacetate decarboxylase [Hexamita inflata]